MSKILKYELKRILWNKAFLAFLLINGVFAWYTLTSTIISGVGYTAPFSGWSFGAYLATLMPILSLTVLFLLSAYFSKKEKKVVRITSATPVDPARFLWVRCLTVTIGFFLIVFVQLVISGYFYIRFFSFSDFTGFILPLLCTLLPGYLLVLGLGVLAGQTHPSLLYVLMLLTFTLCFIQIPGIFDPFGLDYYQSFPITLDAGVNGEPEFLLSAEFLFTRAVYLLAGLGLLTIGVRKATLKGQSA